MRWKDSLSALLPAPSSSPYTVSSVWPWWAAAWWQPRPESSSGCPHSWPAGPPYSSDLWVGNWCTGNGNTWKKDAGVQELDWRLWSWKVVKVKRLKYKKTKFNILPVQTLKTCQQLCQLTMKHSDLQNLSPKKEKKKTYFTCWQISDTFTFQVEALGLNCVCSKRLILHVPGWIEWWTYWKWLSVGLQWLADSRLMDCSHHSWVKPY